jgi:hypothetical protein
MIEDSILNIFLQPIKVIKNVGATWLNGSVPDLEPKGSTISKVSIVMREILQCTISTAT